MRKLYTVLFCLLLPLILMRLYWRGIKAPDYRKRWLERLSVYSKKFPQHVIWFHAVSVGEAEAVFPLVKVMQARYPDSDFLITTTTPTGSARVRAVLADSVIHVYLPYDLPVFINRFLSVFRPKIAIMMEKEIWPNLFEQCGEWKIPLFIINARLSERSARAYKRIPSLVVPALSRVTRILTQTREDKERFTEIGMPDDKIEIAGNIKFDVSIPEDVIKQGGLLKRQSFPGRFVWIVASTHKGEDEIFMDIYQQIKAEIPELLLLLVPRHPERFQSVKYRADDRQLNAVMRSSGGFCTAATDIYIADTMGELKMLYAAADIAFVGGSMVPAGGHNILEPLAVGLPVLFGPHMINFQEIADNVLKKNAALQCMNEKQLIEAVKRLYDDTGFRKALVDHGMTFIAVNQGATDKVFSRLQRCLQTDNVGLGIEMNGIKEY